MLNHELDNVKEEKYLCVIISCNLKMKDHKSLDVKKRFYTTFVKQHLEYASQFWSLNYLKDQNLLEI